MAESYSTSLKITLIGDGDLAGTWGDTTNTNWNLIEQAVTGVDYLTAMGDSNYTLSNLNGTSDEARNQVIVVPSSTTLSATRYIYAPYVPKTYIISNQSSGGNSIYIQGIVSGTPTGSPLLIPNGVTTEVYCDGSTGFYSGATGSAGNFLVNGNLSVTGNQVDVGNISVGGNFNVTGTATGVTVATGNSSTQFATTAFVQNTINSLVIFPSGTIAMWPTTTAPTGFLLCNGTAVSRTTYSALFSVLGTTFGSGDGSTTFNLPNYTDRMPLGTGTIATSVGQTGGSQTTTLTTDNLPAHSHPVVDPGHFHAQGAYRADSMNVGTGPFDRMTSSNTATATTGISIGNTGSGTAATTISPFLGINFIIKT
jgi:microcystin-dependent protein